jgi:hypothetical protein
MPENGCFGLPAGRKINERPHGRQTGRLERFKQWCSRNERKEDHGALPRVGQRPMATVK